MQFGVKDHFGARQFPRISGTRWVSRSVTLFTGHCLCNICVHSPRSGSTVTTKCISNCAFICINWGLSLSSSSRSLDLLRVHDRLSFTPRSSHTIKAILPPFLCVDIITIFSSVHLTTVVSWRSSQVRWFTDYLIYIAPGWMPLDRHYLPCVFFTGRCCGFRRRKVSSSLSATTHDRCSRSVIYILGDYITGYLLTYYRIINLTLTLIAVNSPYHSASQWIVTLKTRSQYFRLMG